MTRSHADEEPRSAADPRVRRLGPRTSLSRSRWGLWLGSLIVAASATALVTAAGAGGTAAQVPSALQVGSQARTVTLIAPKLKVPAPTRSAPSTQRVATATTTTRTAVTKRTKVINPVSTVTDQGDSGRGENSGGGEKSSDSNTVTTVNSTTTTTTASITSSSVDN
ncbi:MAG TPA: hypothetical protein VMV11_01505 [Acidimicrobiales bacterium]|nr:hypothetical protein [Acidimicrobiales bacterium]